jgi:hypothetical protein
MIVLHTNCENNNKNYCLDAKDLNTTSFSLFMCCSCESHASSQSPAGNKACGISWYFYEVA